MAKSIVEYNLLISCPGDVVDEIKAVNRAIKKFNEQYSDILGLRVNSKHWSKDSYNQSGGKAQTLLNKQLVNKCDAAVAIFWTRFGTPTDKYGSGTEEEIEELINADKQVFMYFSSKPVPPEHILDIQVRKEFEKIKAFQQKYADEGKGIFSTYVSTKDFQDKFFAHLSQHFLTLKKIEELSTVKKSNLSIKAINDNGICNTIKRLPFSASGYKKTSDMMSEINELIDKIESYKIKGISSPTNGLFATIHKKVEITDEKKKIIALFVEKCKIALSENFFELGGLKEDLLNSAVLMGRCSFIGEVEEKQKYNDLLKLHEKINDLIGWSPFERLFENFLCIKLVIVNEGNTFDEDIDVVLRFPAKVIILPEDLPIPEKFVLEHILQDGSFKDIFSIIGTAKYNDYQSSIRKSAQLYAQNRTLKFPIELMGSGRDYQKEYKNDLLDVFDYEFFKDNSEIIVKLHIDYLKHNTAVAFPTVLFVTGDLYEVQYSINAKHSDTTFDGVIQVGEST